jgi:hypothetical protein
VPAGGTQHQIVTTLNAAPTSVNSARQRISLLVTVAVFVWLLAGVALTVATPQTAGAAPAPPAPGSLLGGVSVDGYCEAKTASGDELLKGGYTGPDFAYDNWACLSNNVPLDMSALCIWTYQPTYPNLTIVTRLLDTPGSANNADDWYCYVASASGVAPIASTIGTPGELFHSVKHDLVNAAIAGVVVLLIAFPATIFNQALSDNYVEIVGMIAAFRRRVRRQFDEVTDQHAEEDEPPPVAPATTAPEMPGRTGKLWFGATLVLGSILGGLLNPSFGLNAESVEDFLGTLAAFTCGALVSRYVARLFRQHHMYPLATYLRALPLGLGIAAVSMLISRWTGFEPGYLYGVIVSISFIGTLADRHNAHLIAITTLTSLTVSLCAWLAWIPVNHLATEPGAVFPLVILDDALGSIFVAGIFGTVFGLLPLRGLPGGHLTQWRRDVWAALMFVAAFLIIQVELHPASGPTHTGGAPLVTIILLFVSFAGLSFGFRGYFNHRHRVMGAPSVAPSSPNGPVAETPVDSAPSAPDAASGDAP